jgi:serine O-acetyltransferase
MEHDDAMLGISTDEMIREIIESYRLIGGINRIDREDLPSSRNVIQALRLLFEIIFPGYFGEEQPRRSDIYFFVGSRLQRVFSILTAEIERSLKFKCKESGCDDLDCRSCSREIVFRLVGKLPEIREMLRKDVQAAYDGDPAAKSIDEVILCYPFTIAITTHRIAHILYREDVPLIPRIMSEWAHSKTGIDIHPGAQIGEYFFIDHGTGVVIGETTVIGNRVKIYQGVTLGARSFPKDELGRVRKGGKRHPTIEDDVTIYSGATILGGNTVIGRGSVIGANSWITKSVPPYSKVTIRISHAVDERAKKGAMEKAV